MAIDIVYGTEDWNVLYRFVKNGMHVKSEHANFYVMEIKKSKKNKETDNKNDCFLKKFIDAGVVFNVNDNENYEGIPEQYKSEVNSKASDKNIFVLDFSNPQRINFCGELFSIILKSLTFKKDIKANCYGRVFEEFLNFFLLSTYYDGERIDAELIKDIFQMFIDNWYISESIVKIYPQDKTIRIIKAEDHWIHWYKEHNNISD